MNARRPLPATASLSHTLPVQPWRSALYDELHARPFPVVDCPVAVTHLAVISGEQPLNRQAELSHLQTLAQRYSATVPDLQTTENRNCFFQDLGEFEIRWERHTEFSSYTFIRPLDAQTATTTSPFAFSPLNLLPEDWLASLPGNIAVALHLTVLPQPDEPVSLDQLHGFFEGQRLIGSRLARGNAQVWTPFRLHHDGFSRMLVYQQGLNACDNGRLIQQLLEIETYRCLCLLSLPLAREFAPSLFELNQQLAKTNHQIAALKSNNPDRDAALLSQLSGYAAQVEQIRAKTSYRFSATRAYAAIVQKRLDSLQEMPLPGLQTLADFLERRFQPALDTCDAVADRCEQLASRIDRATDLLRTRVDLTIEQQNNLVLKAMNRRAGTQLRLQQAVEGFSVVAVSYYSVELVLLVVDSLAEMGLPLDKHLVTIWSVPALVGLSLAGLYWFRRRLRS